MVLVKKASKHTKTNQYQIFILIMGILITFLSIISLLNWGALGLIFTNCVRLFVGETYPLMMVLFTYIGVNMIFKGRYVQFNLKGLAGSFLIFSSLTISLHYNEFFTRELLAQSVFSETYQIFRNEFLANQIELSLGGGLLGAFYYKICGYLFGRWGSYSLSFVLFFIGLTLVEPYGVKEIHQAFKDLMSSCQQVFHSLGNNFNTARQLVSQKMEEKSSSDMSSEQDSNSVDDRVIDGRQAHQPFSERGFFIKIKHIFEIPQDVTSSLREEVDENLIYEDDNIFVPDQKPAMDYNPHRQFEAYNKKDRLAQTAYQERQKYGEVVLDLDYFEKMYPNHSLKSCKKPVTIDSYEDHLTKKENSSEYASQDDTKDYSHKTSVDEILRQPSQEDQRSMDTNAESISQVNTDKNDHNSQKLPEKDNNHQENMSGLKNSAGHWQSQADTHQRLTDDEVELSLSESDKSHQHPINENKVKLNKDYVLPGKELLIKRSAVDQTEEYERINQNIEKLEQTFKSFGVDATVVKANLGPAVTKYEIEPAVGVKVSKIVSLTDDIALALAARDIRMEAPIPGKSYIGIEVPNTQVSPVSFSEIVDASLNSDHILEVPLGRDVAGSILTADLSKMPHLLIAGSTGSGKSVGMNIIICSLLMKARPEEVKLLLIDPKKVELTMYNDIPHLLSPVVTNPRKAAKALNQVVTEMEERYEKFAKANVRNQESYNEYADRMNKDQGIAIEKMPKIVVFIDELADLMLVAGNEVENAIIRLAQMARAAGIHMIIATQRPSVDVITGIIKANIPSRLAFAVTSGTDSRTILDANGAEKLLGKGDMLFQPISMNKSVRVQGAYISDAEVERITNFIKEQRDAEYDERMIITDETMSEAEASEDEYFGDAVNLIKDQETVSISQIQRKFRVGYNRAARIIDDLEALGYISPADGSKPRQVYINE